jgi:hypothetical protein
MSLKNKIREKIKKYSNKDYLEEYIKNEFFLENGKADIFINLHHINQLFDSRTSDTQLALNDDIYAFIENKSSVLDNDIQITLHIIGLDLSSKDEETVRHLIKEHYATELYKKQKEYNSNKSKIFNLFSIGIFFLCVYTAFYLLTNFELFKTLFVFLFSFSLWEAFDLFIFSFNNLKNESEIITQLLLMDVDFDKKIKE